MLFLHVAKWLLYALLMPFIWDSIVYALQMFKEGQEKGKDLEGIYKNVTVST